MGRVRLYQGADAAACCEVINSAVRDMGGLNDAARRRIYASNVAPCLHEQFSRIYAVVYEAGDGVAGTGALDGDEIKRLYVHPSAQGRGVGSAILAALEAEARLRSLPSIRLAASPSSVRFYERHGYRRLREGELSIEDARFSYVDMAKDLPALW